MTEFDSRALPETLLDQAQAQALEACEAAGIVDLAACYLTDEAGFTWTQQAEFTITGEEIYAGGGDACAYDRQPIGRAVYVGFSTPIATENGEYAPRMRVAEFLNGFDGAINASGDYFTDDQVAIVIDGLLAADEVKLRSLKRIQDFLAQRDAEPGL